MQLHPVTNPNAASAPPVARPLSDFSLLAQLEHEVHVDTPKKHKTTDERVCSDCGELKNDREYYHRLVADKTHLVGSHIQPCKVCRREYARLDRLKKKEKKQNDGR